ncbi:MAG: phenylacetate--CoA ligase family protein, partial [Candidatus Omnitrophota bacterium]
MYPKLYKNILFPFYETFLRKRNTLKYLKYLEKTQWYSPERLREIQWERLQRLLRYAYE